MSSVGSKDLPEEGRGRGRASGGRSPNPAYELFVLGELMTGAHHGYILHEIIQRMLGPFHRLSWGTLYPLFRRLEQQGLITSETEPRSQEEGGQPRKLYHITEAGQSRFFTLMLDRGEYSPDYQDLFMVKLSKFVFLTSPQQLVVLQQYREYLRVLREHYYVGGQSLPFNPVISEQERPFLLQIADYQVLTLDAKL
ncbi:MAG TPA: PadR family transcriptional regulator, partial [Ktedonosporobacter sp.]|nr:PadR family transcriptional regulator [Ktedonosporobacter sp.]